MELPRTVGIIEAGIAQHLHPAAQLYVSLRGTVVADLGIGQTSPGVPMRADSLTAWFSAGKPVTAVAIAQLLERGQLRLDDRVAEHVPEFGANGKEPITVRHLLTHTGGFRGPLNNFVHGTWDQIVAKVCEMRLEPGWTPGKKAGYHPGSSWFMLGELIRRIDGRSVDRYVRDEIFLPMGEADAWVGMPESKIAEYGARLAPTVIREPHEFKGKTPWNDPHGLVVPRPGGNARGPIRALGRLYEQLLAGLSSAGAEALKLSRDTIRQLTTRQRVGMFDHTFKCVLDFGLGFLIDSKQYAGEHPYGYGKHSSWETFGHGGNQSSCAFADPRHGLVVAWVCTGMPGEQAHDRRARAINAAVYEDLGLDVT